MSLEFELVLENLKNTSRENERLQTIVAEKHKENARLLTHATNAADMLTRRDEENERLRSRIVKLQSLGAVDVEGLRAQIEELTKHNHALAERAKRAEASTVCITLNGLRYIMEGGQ